MNRVEIDEQGHTLLDEWRQANAALIRTVAACDAYFFERFEIAYTGAEITGEVFNRKKYLEIKVKEGGAHILTIKLRSSEQTDFFS